MCRRLKKWYFTSDSFLQTELVKLLKELTQSNRDDLELAGVEILWIEVKNNNQKPFLLCYSYRPSSAAYNDWIIKLESVIERANTEQKEIILLGDFSFNLLSETNVTKHWLDTTNNLNLKQFVQTPTRITNSTRTLIDHAFTNVQENITHVSALVYALSDHYPVCLTRKISNDFDRGPVHKLIHTGTQNHSMKQNSYQSLKIIHGQ